ncbi:MAG: alpha-amylase family glycosyl hydrolase [Firmicutes bacterium]|nr:alpha-amylase family glycosyl hydrolase [Bacillota bacterium]
MPSWLKDAVFYEIYPQSFYDSNGDGIGDLPGILRKLDYIQALGVNAIWLNPVYDSPFWDAGYDVRDHKKVAPRYGTDEDLIELFQAAHEKGMHILLDLVPGHTAIDHPWFQAAQRAEQNEFSGRYVFTPEVWDAPPEYRWLTGVSERNGAALVNFFSVQPALNYGFHDIKYPAWQNPPEHPDCQAALEVLKDVMRFWLDRGADGFRVDMADSLVKNDGEKIATAALWRSVRTMLDRDYPEAALVAEWSHPERAVNRAGFHMDFYLDHRYNGYHSLFRRNEGGEDLSFISKAGRGDITHFTEDYVPQYEATRENGYISFLTCNHDTPRLTRFLDVSEIKLAYAMIFTLPGVPFLYYGDEIGMRFIEGLPSVEGGYNRTGARTPMQWDSGENLGFSAAPAEKLYLPVDSAPDAPTVEAQTDDPNSLLNTVKSLIALRRRFSDLGAGVGADGDFEVVYAEKEKFPFVYRRGKFLIFVNPAAWEVRLDWDNVGAQALGDVVYEIGRFARTEGEVVLGPQTFAVAEG